ncbi:MAG: hypothetical protein DME94_10940, partial [Verrucomicrobia bacterium]
FSSCIGAAGATFGRASAGLDTISGAAGFETGTGAGFSIARFDSTLISDAKGTFGKTGGTRSAGRAGGVTGIAGATGISFGRASTGLGTISGAGAFEIGVVTGGSVARFDSTLTSDTASTGSLGEAGGTCAGGDDGGIASIGVGRNVTGTGGGTGFATAGNGAGVDTVGGFQGRDLEGVRSTGADGGVASGETVELPGRSVNPAEPCPGTRGTMPSAFKTSRNTLPHDESSTCRAITIDKIRFDCSDRPGTATYP